MITKFSKPSNDIARETQSYIDRNDELLEKQYRVSQNLRRATNRVHCLLCEESIQSLQTWNHRGVEYFRCHHCGHIQTRIHPPRGYPFHQSEAEFNKVYPKLNSEEFDSRTLRIYTPKLDWILESLSSIGIPSEKVLTQRWLEIGSGGGYFLNALRKKGASNILGLERDPGLVTFANEALAPHSYSSLWKTRVENIPPEFSADVYCAFFVLEHVDEPQVFFKSLSQLPPGTLFAFSVPTLGLSTLLEISHESHFARNLDSMLHTQLYTEESLRYALTLAKMDWVSEWVFGQDASDLYRFLSLGLRKHASSEAQTYLQSQIESIVDPIQSTLDRSRLSDARHILAVRR